MAGIWTLTHLWWYICSFKCPTQSSNLGEFVSVLISFFPTSPMWSTSLYLVSGDLIPSKLPFWAEIVGRYGKTAYLPIIFSKDHPTFRKLVQSCHINHRNVDIPSPLLPSMWHLSGPIYFLQTIFLMPQLHGFRGWEHFRQNIVSSPWHIWRGEFCLPPKHYRKWGNGIISNALLSAKGREVPSHGYSSCYSTPLPRKFSDWSTYIILAFIGQVPCSDVCYDVTGLWNMFSPMARIAGHTNCFSIIIIEKNRRWSFTKKCFYQREEKYCEDKNK